jgi:PadR family transcriptional regulator, regulatory protein PadR
MDPRSEATNTQNWEAQLRKGSLELAILASLWEDRRLYGLEIVRVLKDQADLKLAEGTIYPILGRLTADELILSEWVDAETGHPRKYYWLTDKGRQKARALAEVWVRFVMSLRPFLEPLLPPPSGS